MQNKTTFILLFILILLCHIFLCHTKARANIDLIVENPEELKRLYEEGIYSYKGLEVKEPSFLTKKTLEKPRSLLPIKSTDIQREESQLKSIIKKRDPIFDDIDALQNAMSGEDLSNINSTRKSPINTQDVQGIVSRVGVRKEKPAVEPDKLQGLVLVGGEHLINDSKTGKLYAEEKLLNNKDIQIIGFNNQVSNSVINVFPAMGAYLNQEISLELLDEIISILKEQIRSSNIPFTNIYAPPQDIKDGIVYLVIKPALVEDVRIAKSQYFDELRVLNKIEQELGEPVDAAKLENDLAVLSLHPDRQFKATFAPGDTENTTRIDIDIEEQKPWRVYATRSNDGSEDLDKDLMAFGGYHNNLWGLDHKASYQYTTSGDRKSLRAHNFEYTLPYYDTHSLVMRYTRSKTQASVLDNAFDSRGDFSQVGLRHRSEFIGTKEIAEGWSLSEQKLFVGIDKKKIDGDILFSLFGDSLDTGVGADVEVFNTAFDYEGVLKDPLQGKTRLSANLVYSPGGVGSKNKDRDFVTARANTKSSYSYLRFKADRELPLAYKLLDKPFKFKHGFQGQISPNRLIGSERFINSYRPGFRGYKSGELSGDSGIAGYLELETSTYNLIANGYYTDALKASIFTDFGTFFNNNASTLEDQRSSIFSVGGAMKYQINDNVNSEVVVAQDISGQGDDMGQSFMYRLLFGF